MQLSERLFRWRPTRRDPTALRRQGVGHGLGKNQRDAGGGARGAFEQRVLSLLANTMNPENRFFDMVSWNKPLNRTTAHYPARLRALSFDATRARRLASASIPLTAWTTCTPFKRHGRRVGLLCVQVFAPHSSRLKAMLLYGLQLDTVLLCSQPALPCTASISPLVRIVVLLLPACLRRRAAHLLRGPSSSSPCAR